MIETKRCSKCAEIKPLSQFHRRGRGFQSACAACRKTLYYEPNKKAYIERGAESRRRRYALMRLEVLEYLKAHPCIDCGETDLVVLDFDHRERANKRATISDILRDGLAVETLRSEMEKCDVRCANCHRKKTALKQGWFKLDR